MIEILVADDHPLFRYAITDFVERNIPDTQTITCTDLEEALAQAEENPNIDLVLLDLNMPGMDGLNGIVRFRNLYPEVPIVIVSAEEDKSVVLQSFTYGAVGFITKSSSCEQIVAAIQQVLSGQVYLPPDIIRKGSVSEPKKDLAAQQIDPKLIGALTRRQLLVFECITKGKSNKQIAYELNIAETTVKAHVSAILNKLNVHNRIQAALCAANIDFNQYLIR
ncbi:MULTISPECIES: response regulator [Aliiglaciecola]|uniref:response regulator n=1 Tax=Aliiglaciecola TaxID=1406885 RepID=UPI001C0A2ABB|nr:MULTISPECIES: response regulator transcription factor [Aliiglaciecola]MBU2878421.1 response regulator transcription factor [Aliiglaciecola lipolytica]MDO6711749.1 response regulator transcription factor [Aliiglaciecola sp. 2_MG-2023]MDO6752820.1 response regulator transcription factor [Aliiglaciecola sp. 1_MG-2023]